MMDENKRFAQEQEALRKKEEERKRKEDGKLHENDKVGKALAQIVQVPAWEEVEKIFLEHFTGAYKDLRNATKDGDYKRAAYAEATLSAFENIYSDISNGISLGEKAYQKYLGKIFKKVSGDQAE